MLVAVGRAQCREPLYVIVADSGQGPQAGGCPGQAGISTVCQDDFPGLFSSNVSCFCTSPSVYIACAALKYSLALVFVTNMMIPFHVAFCAHAVFVRGP